MNCDHYCCVIANKLIPLSLVAKVIDAQADMRRMRPMQYLKNRVNRFEYCSKCGAKLSDYKEWI